MLSRALLVTSVVLAVAGCSANLPDGRFRCTADSDCPASLHCHTDHLCYRDVEIGDAAMPRDGGDAAMVDGGSPDDGGNDAGTDAGADAFVAPDAAACTASDCVTLTVTNAYGSMGAGLSFMVESTSMPFPAYGETTSAFEVALGGNAKLDISSSVLGSTQIAATGHAAYALVVGRDPDPANLTPVIRLLPLSFVAPSSGTFRVYPIDMMQDGAAFALVAEGNLHRIDRATDGGVLMLTTAKRTSITLHRFAMDGVSPDVMLAAYDASELPQDGAYYAALVGNPAAHLGAVDGLRIIPIVPGLHLTPSWPVVFTLNVASDPITICDGLMPLATVVPGAIQQGLPSFGPTTPTGMGATLFLSPTSCADLSARSVTIPAASAADVSGRVLLAIEGLVPSMWGGGAHIEAPPTTTGASQVVTYGNGSVTGSAGFGSAAMGIRAPSTPPLGAAFLEWTVRPSELVVSYGTVTYEYDWIPTSSTAAVFWITDDATNHVAYEISTPFGQNWTVDVRVPR